MGPRRSYSPKMSTTREAAQVVFQYGKAAHPALYLGRKRRWQLDRLPLKKRCTLTRGPHPRYRLIEDHTGSSRRHQMSTHSRPLTLA